MIKAFTLLLSLLAFGAQAQPLLTPGGESLPAPATARIAIIIDDLGYSRSNGLRTARLPAALTLAVLPHTPNGAELARIGHNSGKEIILHTPMPNTQGKSMDKGTLTADMDQATFLRTLRKNLAAVPHITGANNHMGSGLTANPEAMQWLMQELKQRNLFFVDSRTTAASVALSTAIDSNLLSGRRDVFLDNERTQAQISRQFDRLIELARQRGQALAIGHPYPETLDVLEQRLPELRLAGIELVPASRLLHQPSPRSIQPQKSIPPQQLIQPPKSFEPPRLLRFPPVASAPAVKTKPHVASILPMPKLMPTLMTTSAPQSMQRPPLKSSVVKPLAVKPLVVKPSPVDIDPPLAPPVSNAKKTKLSVEPSSEASNEAKLGLEPSWDDLSPYIN